MYEDPHMMLRLARERQVELKSLAAKSHRSGTRMGARLRRLLSSDVVLRWQARRARR